jgi:hypothetical protein
MICDDISKGLEKYKVPVYNGNDNAKISESLEYELRCYRREEHVGKREPCNCPPGGCNSLSCSCLRASQLKVKVKAIIKVSIN